MTKETKENVLVTNSMKNCEPAEQPTSFQTFFPDCWFFGFLSYSFIPIKKKREIDHQLPYLVKTERALSYIQDVYYRLWLELVCMFQIHEPIERKFVMLMNLLP